MKFAVIQTGGKQYVVRKDDEITVDNLNVAQDADVEFETLAEGDDEKNDITLGKPFLTSKVKGKVLENVKGDKIRVARFKSKVRSRKVRGFRAALSRVKITTI
ncbi:MAG: 50S ribosomal protein L21 [Microgenomates bacterium OLB23]|nr:MAG: 50S ribosomal protein L21 [Microgenomates bacterium OLB23]